MRLTERVHHVLRDRLQPGQCAIDATAGNGHDTRVLAQLVAPGGQVIAIDRQANALAATRARLEEAGLTGLCSFHQGDHAELLTEWLPDRAGTVHALTFNLGYLPGGEKAITTTAPSTRRALDAARELLAPGGLLCVTAYRGHPGGKEEAEAVQSWMTALEPAQWQVESHTPETRHPDRPPPVLWIAERTRP